jgi:arabinofuranosyltransferase
MTFPLLVLTVLGVAGGAFVFARITQWYGAAAAGASALVLGLHSVLYYDGYTSDDAYITYRYARNLAGGEGPVWNPGERVEGYTNFLWMLVLAGADVMSFSVPATAEWLGLALAVIAGLGTYLLARELLPGDGGQVAGLAAAILLASCGSWTLWAGAGLEGPLLAVLVLAGVLLHVREEAGRAPAGVATSGVAWGLAALTRPDALLFFAVSAGCKAGGFIQARSRGPGDGEAWRAGARSPAMSIFGFAVIYVPYFAWRWWYYGHLLPNTYYAKVGGGLDQYDRGLRYVMAFAQEYAAWAILLVPLAAAVGAIRARAGLYVCSLVLVWLAYTAYVGGDSLLRWRFVTPVLPMLYAAAAAAVAGTAQVLWAQRPRESSTSVLVAQAGAAVLGLAAVAYTLHPSAAGAGSGFSVDAEARAVDEHAAIGRWLRRTMPADTTIAVVASGALPFEARLRAIDMLGLNDEHIAHRDLDLGSFAAGHEKYDSGYVLDLEPDIIFLSELLTPSPLSRADYEAVAASALIPALEDMLRNPRLWTDYESRAFELAEGAWINLFVRRDASAVLAKTVASPR